MPTKSRIKKAVAETQDNLCTISNVGLEANQSLNDAHRLVDKHNGGLLSFNNMNVVEPVAHMNFHGNLRTREDSLNNLKSLFDDHVQMTKLVLKINNQRLAYQRRTDHLHPETSAFLDDYLKPVKVRLELIDKQIAKAVKNYPDPLVKSAMGVKGLGPISVAALTVYIDLQKAATPSALWKYVGFDVPSHERYVKGQSGGGNKTLRTAMYNTALVMIKLKVGGYREVYDRVKQRLSISERMVKSRNTEGKLIECAWKDTKPSHRHGAAIRKMINHILADYWLVGRTLAGLSTTPLYAESMLGHTHIISPRERGWEF